MRVSVLGLGYVGCVTAACLAKAGHEVIGVDINEDKINVIASGRSPIVEHGLDTLLAEVVANKRLTVTTSTADAISRSDVALICVGTPSDRRGRLSLDAVERAAQEIGCALRGRTEPFTLVVRSTVLPGVTERIVLPALRAEAGPEASALVRYAMNPEFMREGCSLRDFAQPPCTVVGTPSDEAANVLRGLYSAVNAPFLHTSICGLVFERRRDARFHRLGAAHHPPRPAVDHLHHRRPQSLTTAARGRGCRQRDRHRHGR